MTDERQYKMNTRKVWRYQRVNQEP